MIEVEFAPSLRRHVDCPTQAVTGATLGQALDAALRGAPALAHYVFDDQHCIRKHVAVFVNQQMVRDRQDLQFALAAGDRVLVIQALSGG